MVVMLNTKPFIKQKQTYLMGIDIPMGYTDWRPRFWILQSSKLESYLQIPWEEIKLVEF